MVRCELSRTVGHDPTGESAVECGALAEYCELCEVNVCPACHEQIGSPACGVKKSPSSVRLETASPTRRRA